jgi:hypothetical protein
MEIGVDCSWIVDYSEVSADSQVVHYLRQGTHRQPTTILRGSGVLAGSAKHLNENTRADVSRRPGMVRGRHACEEVQHHRRDGYSHHCSRSCEASGGRRTDSLRELKHTRYALNIPASDIPNISIDEDDELSFSNR